MASRAFCLFLICFNHHRQGMRHGFDVGTGSVEANIVICGIPPGLPGVGAVVSASVAVNRKNFASELSLARDLIFLPALAASRHTKIHVCIHKNAKRLSVTKNVIGASAHDHAVGALCQLPNDVGLLCVDRGILLHQIIRRAPLECSAHRNGKMIFGTLLHDAVNVFLCQFSPLCNLRNDLAVIIRNAKFVRQTLSKLSAAASELPSYGDDPTHFQAPFSSSISIIAPHAKIVKGDPLPLF